MDNIESLCKDRIFRQELVNIRKSKKLTQKQVAELSGLSESCVSNIESGKDTSPTLRSLIRYMDALNLDIYIKNINLENKKKEIESGT